MSLSEHQKEILALLGILIGILWVIETSNVIYHHREWLKEKARKALNKFKRKKNKNIEFD